MSVCANRPGVLCNWCPNLSVYWPSFCYYAIFVAVTSKVRATKGRLLKTGCVLMLSFYWWRLRSGLLTTFSFAFCTVYLSHSPTISGLSRSPLYLLSFIFPLYFWSPHCNLCVCVCTHTHAHTHQQSVSWPHSLNVRPYG